MKDAAVDDTASAGDSGSNAREFGQSVVDGIQDELMMLFPSFPKAPILVSGGGDFVATAAVTVASASALEDGHRTPSMRKQMARV